MSMRETKTGKPLFMWQQATITSDVLVRSKLDILKLCNVKKLLSYFAKFHKLKAV